MSNHKRIFAAWGFTVLLFALRAPADELPAENSATATNKPAFKASLRSGETIGNHQVQRALLEIGTNQIAFIIPTGFWMDSSNPQKIVLTQTGMRSFITVGVGRAVSESNSYKEEALRRYPGAKIVRETTEMAAGHSGPAYDLEWTNPGGVAQSARISFIPSAGGVLELCVLARSADFKDARIYFNSLLASLQTNESGKLVIVPLPDFS